MKRAAPPTQRGLVQPRTLNVEGAVAYTGLSRAALYRLIADDAVPSFSIGSRRMFYAADLDAFIDRAAGRVPAQAEAA